MFPIRPCADAVRSGISVLWTSTSLLHSSKNGYFTSRVLIRQFQCISNNRLSSSVTTTAATSPCSNDKQLTSTTTISQSTLSASPATTHHQPPPPALNQVLRGEVELNGVNVNKREISDRIKYSATAAAAPTPKGIEKDGQGQVVDHQSVSQLKLKQSGDTRQASSTSSGSSSSDNKPSPDQLLKTYNALQQSLERTFTHPMDYSIYHPDIIFIDNIRHIRTQGLAKYIQQVALLKMVGHVKFAYVRFDILNMSMIQEDARITVRWRIKGLSGIRVMLKFWKFKLWKWQEIMNHQETWYDGISYFDVGADGKIFQHVADKVMEDKDRIVDDKPATGGNIPFAAKLGALGAIAFPVPSLSCSHSQSAPSANSSTNETQTASNSRSTPAVKPSASSSSSKTSIIS